MMHPGDDPFRDAEFPAQVMLDDEERAVLAATGRSMTRYGVVALTSIAMTLAILSHCAERWGRMLAELSPFVAWVVLPAILFVVAGERLRGIARARNDYRTVMATLRCLQLVYVGKGLVFIGLITFVAAICFLAPFVLS